MTDRMRTVQGHCPACRGASRFLGDGGHVTCSRIDCPDPSAADDLLHGNPSAVVPWRLTEAQKPAPDTTATQATEPDEADDASVYEEMLQRVQSSGPRPVQGAAPAVSAPAGLREQYAAAVDRVLAEWPEHNRIDEHKGVVNETTSAVLAVRDRRMEQLAATLDEVLDALVRNGGVPPTEADVDRWRAVANPPKEQP